ncbi:MAG TPA: hypothetical protein VKE95_15965 [Burkholderiales bacterium]|nr:hypothetical protein [Burkholderiales bacterium]
MLLELLPLEPLGGYALLELLPLGQSAPVQFAELEAPPEAEVPELGDDGVVLPPLPVEAPTDVPLPALPPLCAHAAASVATAKATAIAFNAI